MPSTSTSNRVPISRKIRKKLAKQREIELEERKLSIYRRSCFQGAAIVRLSDLKSDINFNRDTNNHPNIARLEQLFNYHGFLRLDEKYHIPVMIDTSEWEKRVKWQDPKSLAPEVPLPELEVAHGCHLFVLDHEDVIAAAEKRFKELNVEEPWCVVDVYVTEAEEACDQRDELIRTLQESYSNDRFPPDGRIYRKIRSYQGYPHRQLSNKAAENYWWAVLESSPGIDGLWDDMSIGVLHKLLAMKCDEPIICYLRKIKDTFYKLAGNDNNILAAVDGGTIRKIKSLAPKVSKGDLEFLETGMENKDLFPAIVAPQPKRKIKRRRNSEEEDNQEEEEEEAEGTSPTIDESLRSQYNSLSESGLISSAHIEVLLKRDLCDLWRFSFQYAFEMTTVKEHRRRVPRKHVDVERAISLGLHERHNSFDLADLRHHFLWLASNRGFEVPANNESQLQPVELPRAMPSDFPPDNEDVGLERRSGKPFTDSVDADRFALSRESLRSVSNYQRVSAAFVRRSVFNAFFAYFDAGIPDSPVLSPRNVVAEPSPDEIDVLLADTEAAWGAEARYHGIIADGEFALPPYAGVSSVPHIPMEDRTTYAEWASWDQYRIDPF
ncbi:hypothetical protein PENNAL_c0090G03114 [Penicillium nalgiovense]|uniref:Uncharacterized protein n=1 Tax=Penicillium nalgiovense TaxID=60175 RepID=A0A1V6XDX4_PENNA|nr:hypothetical protein PENNAL_c0090G03114 [Penicillium nalgiovense]